MSISGIAAVIDLERWADVLQALQSLPGVDLHQRDETQGRVVLTQEADTTEAQMDGLRAIQQIPGVRMAELVYHYVGDGDEEPEAETPATIQ